MNVKNPFAVRSMSFQWVHHEKFSSLLFLLMRGAKLLLVQVLLKSNCPDLFTRFMLSSAISYCLKQSIRLRILNIIVFIMAKMFIGWLLSITVEKRSFSVYFMVFGTGWKSLAFGQLPHFVTTSGIKCSDSEYGLLFLIHIPSSYTLYLPINETCNHNTVFGVAWLDDKPHAFHGPWWTLLMRNS